MAKNKKRSFLITNIYSWIISRIYILLFLIVERLPLEKAYLFGRFMGSFLFYISGHRRKIVEKNISILKSWAKKQNLESSLLTRDNKTIAKKIYQANAANFLYSFCIMNKSESIIKKHIKVKDLGLLEEAYSRKKGVVILFAHSGPFELMVMLPKLIPSIFNNIEIAAMYRPLNNRYMNNWYLRRRRRFGTQLFSREDGFFKILRHLKKGAFINVAFDIRMNQGEKIELFDKLASSSKIPHVLHKTTHASILAVKFVRTNNLGWEIRFKEIASPEIEFYSEYDLLKAANQYLEQMIFENPCDYFFFQDRYK